MQCIQCNVMIQYIAYHLMNTGWWTQCYEWIGNECNLLIFPHFASIFQTDDITLYVDRTETENIFESLQ